MIENEDRLCAEIGACCTPQFKKMAHWSLECHPVVIDE